MAPEHFSHPLHSNYVSPDFWKGKSRSPASFFFSISGKISGEVRFRGWGWGSGFGFGLWRSPWPDLEGRPGVAGRPGGGGGREAVRPAAVPPPAGRWRRPVGPGRGGATTAMWRRRRRRRREGQAEEPRAREGLAGAPRLGKQGGGGGASAEEGGGRRVKMNSARKIHHRQIFIRW